MPPALAPMLPPRRANRMLLLVFGTGAAIGLQLGVLHVFLWRSWTALGAFLVPALGDAAIVYTLWRWVFPRLRARTLPAQITLQAFVSLLVFAVLSTLTTELIATLRGAPSLFGAPTGVEKQFTASPEQQQMVVRLYAFAPIIPTVLLALIGYHQYWRRVLFLQHRERELVELAATAQLAALRAQINPHLLFNSLNSIAQLIRTDPDRAEACVERLAEMFRYVLRHREEDFVPLADELEMARAYLDIEHARFGDRLRLETHIDSPSLHQLIPSLVLQPLVENAVKHGLCVLKQLEEQRKVYVSQVPVHSGKRVLIVPVTDVLWFGVDYRLVYAHTGERAFMTNYTLRDLEERLDPALFFRAHKSNLVNLKHVKEIVPWFGGRYKLVMRDAAGSEVALSRAQTRTLRARLRW